MMNDQKERKEAFKQRVYKWAEKLNSPVVSISIRRMTTKWASYSTSGRLTFDQELLELQPELQDYVIVHELLHFHVPNHGKLWKSLMRLHLGDYEGLEKTLRDISQNDRIKGLTHLSFIKETTFP
ncbi:MAG: hypothetical protein Kow0042_22340 [Calditrichia bacterium]